MKVGAIETPGLLLESRSPACKGSDGVQSYAQGGLYHSGSQAIRLSQFHPCYALAFKNQRPEREDNIESYDPECLNLPPLVPWAAMDPRYPLLVWVLWASAVSHPPEASYDRGKTNIVTVSVLRY